MSEKRKHIFIEGLKPNLYEWGMLEEQSTLEGIRNLSQRTMLIYDPKTVRSILEITELLKDACPDWDFEKVPEPDTMLLSRIPNGSIRRLGIF